MLLLKQILVLYVTQQLIGLSRELIQLSHAFVITQMVTLMTEQVDVLLEHVMTQVRITMISVGRHLDQLFQMDVTKTQPMPINLVNAQLLATGNQQELQETATV